MPPSKASAAPDRPFYQVEHPVQPVGGQSGGQVRNQAFQSELEITGQAVDVDIGTQRARVPLPGQSVPNRLFQLRQPRRPGITKGRVGPQSRVVLLVTGDGLKTPGPVAHTYDPIMIEADADAFVDEVLVA